ncbi:MAG TPA: metal-dependent transcriptional regulator [Anaerolineales bacterium]|nr:metal-dependent transcriptional regulator [Anaerolineales bacterium]
MSDISPQVQDYLKAIYELERRTGGASTNAIAEALGVRPASVTGMLKKLASMKLIRHTPYQGARLTPRGEKIALEVVRHHRLLELFLIEVLGYSWDEVHHEADRLEHFISEDFEDRLAARLGHPEVDPHGDPIPAKDGTLADPCQNRLDQLAPGATARIARVDDRDPARLRHAAELGLIPSAQVTLLETDPYGGSLRLRIEKQERSVGPELARWIYVEEVPEVLPLASPEPADA